MKKGTGNLTKMSRRRRAFVTHRRGRTRLPWKRGLLLAFLLTGTFVASVSQESRTAFAEILRDPLSVLSERSPGERAPGALHRSKPAKQLAAATLPPPFAPAERVLSEVRTRPPILFGPDTPIVGPIVPEAAAPTFVPAALNTVPVGNVPGLPGLPFIGIPPGPDDDVTPPGEEPETPDTPDTPDTPELPPPPIPEPGTWLTMILGFLAAGLAMRRRRSFGTMRRVQAGAAGTGGHAGS
jgi:hypothetical protein